LGRLEEQQDVTPGTNARIIALEPDRITASLGGLDDPGLRAEVPELLSSGLLHHAQRELLDGVWDRSRGRRRRVIGLVAIELGAAARELDRRRVDADADEHRRAGRAALI